MENKSINKRQGITLKRIKNSQINLKLTQTLLETQSKKDLNKQNTKIKKINNLQNNISIKRANTTLLNRNNSNLQDMNTKQNKHQLHHKTMPTKFTKLSLNNPICNHRDQNIQKLVEQITPKSQCFYKFGFKSSEKPSHKRVFSDIMGIPKQEMKGLLFIGQLWTNQLTQNFMKANNVNMSKRKLFEKLRDMKWEKVKKQKQKMMDSRQLIASVRQFSDRSQKSIQSFPQFQSMISINNIGIDFVEENTLRSEHQSITTSQKLVRKQKFEQISKTYRQSLDIIRSSIDRESKRCKDEDYRRMMKSLQKQSGQIHHLWDRYFTKMVENQ